jgi:cyclopropane fatty-acyl-phospholipid synthase-like methyltransferase
MANLQQIKQAAAQLHLNLDNPKSVRNQLQRVNQAQEKLRQLRQEVNTQLQGVNKPKQNLGLDEAAAIGLHIFGQHRIAREVTRQGNRVERQEIRQEQQAKQPYIKMRDLIDNYIFEGDRLKTMAETYLQQH